jgi:hypothetical protein
MVWGSVSGDPKIMSLPVGFEQFRKKFEIGVDQLGMTLADQSQRFFAPEFDTALFGVDNTDEVRDISGFFDDPVDDRIDVSAFFSDLLDDV